MRAEQDGVTLSARNTDEPGVQSRIRSDSIVAWPLVVVFLFFYTLCTVLAQSGGIPGNNVMVTASGSGTLIGTFNYGNGRIDYITNNIVVNLQFHPYSPQASGYYYASTVADFSGSVTLSGTAIETEPGTPYTDGFNNTINYNEPDYAVASEFFGPQFFTSSGASLAGEAASLNLTPPTAGGSPPLPTQLSYNSSNAELTVWITFPSPFQQDTTGWPIPCTMNVSSNGSTIQGTVLDASTGNPLPGATAVIAGQTYVCNSSGIFSVPLTPPGFLGIQITDPGYQTFAATNVLPPFSAVQVTFRLNPSPVAITALRISSSQSTASAGDEIDAPIMPTPAPSVLSTASALGLGVCADDVTPVLFQFTGPQTNYTVQIAANATYNGSLPGQISVLQNGQWVSTTSIPASCFSSSDVCYFYLSGMTWANFSGASGNQAMITVSVCPGGSLSPVATTNFLVRPPPIGLVHGIADDGTTWSYAFTNELANYEPEDFIIPITYGRGSGPNAFPNNLSWPCTYDAFSSLSVTLDQSLQQQLEAPLHANWAFTRYDAVGHSQGGVLLRMLCQNNITGQGAFSVGQIPVVSQTNLYRGRFRRVITIGSPHNGTLIGWYVHQVESSIDPADEGWFSQVQFALFSLMAAVAPEKFDPFGQQIEAINDANTVPIDGRIRFNCIQTTIGGGGPPPVNLLGNSVPPSYYLSGLCFPTGLSGESRGQVIIPNGSDGVVDYSSEGGGNGTPITQITDNNIAHAEAPQILFYGPLFGVPANQSDTKFPEVADTIRNLLNGPVSRFNSFVLPNQLSSTTEQSFINTLKLGSAVMNLINLLPQPAIPTTNINCILQVPTDLPNAEPINWFALVFGTNGFSTNGVSIAINTNDSTQVTVSVGGNLQGQVVLYAFYMATNGVMVIAEPVVAVSYPSLSSLTGIQINPASAQMSIGDVLPTTLWGNYQNVTNSLLYVPPGQAMYSSSNTNVAVVDSNGTITMVSPGEATISVSYNGFTSQMAVFSSAPRFTASRNNSNKLILQVAGAPNFPYILQSATNLAPPVNWQSIFTNSSDSNGNWSVMVTNITAQARMFYRAMGQ